MKFPAAFTLLAMALSALGASSQAEEKAAPAALQQFEALKKLAGDWVEVGKDGNATDKLVSSIRVTSGGSAVHETLFPGSDHEMITLYHLDGDALVLTHYCTLGNQPHLQASPGKDVHRIEFKFKSGTNLQSADDHHMHDVTFTIAGPDRFKSEWVSSKEGKTCHQVVLDLVRKQD